MAAGLKKVKNSVDAPKRDYLNAVFLKYGRIAQLVEQRTENPCVPSSILGPATTIFPAASAALEK